MSKKDLLKEKAKGKLATSALKPVEEKKVVSISGSSELVKITREIRSDLDEMKDIAEWWNDKKIRINELKENIVTKLMYVRDHKKQLLPDRTFESYLSEDIGISKGYFYEQIQAYNLCIEHKKPSLFKEVDHKVLVNIAREKDVEKQKELLKKAPELSREDFKKDRSGKVSPTDFSKSSESSPPVMDAQFRVKEAGMTKTLSELALGLLKTSRAMFYPDMNDVDRQVLAARFGGISDFSKLLRDYGYITDDEYKSITRLHSDVIEYKSRDKVIFKINPMELNDFSSISLKNVSQSLKFLRGENRQKAIEELQKIIKTYNN